MRQCLKVEVYNHAYVRVSTEKQTVENQKLVIKEFCKCHRITKLNWISETFSGTKNPEKRKLGELINLVNDGDVVVITELSRLGRSLIMIFNVLQIFLEKKVKVIAIKENYELGDNIQSKVIAFAFGLSAEIELGRRKGVSPAKYKLTGKENYIRRQLKKGRSKRSLAIELKSNGQY